MEKNLEVEIQNKKRIRLGKRFSKIEHESVDDERADSHENSTENTKKKILPNRLNRGSRMKDLQGKELEGENELYDLIFAEKSSDEDFNPSQSDLSHDESIKSEKEDNSEINEDNKDDDKEYNSEEDKIMPPIKKKRLGIKISKKKGARNLSPHVPINTYKKKFEEEEILDLERIDLDKIDELEDMRDRGEDIEEINNNEESESISESENENENGSHRIRKKNKISNKKRKFGKPVILVHNNEAVENKNKKRGNKPRRAFIDVSDDEKFTRKRPRSIKPSLRGKSYANKKQKIIKNKNVIFKNINQIMIINKSIFNENNDSDEKNYQIQENEEDIMKYNDEGYSCRQNIEEENKNTKNLIKKFKKQEKPESAPVKYTFMQEKLSQKELLLEAIFTEYYNIQSLQEMQRLDDLNKKEMSTPGKKQFTEFVRVVKRNKENLVKDEIKINEGSSSIDKNIIVINEEKKETQINNACNTSYESNVTFSNPLIFEKIFEIFNRLPTAPKEKKMCVITGQPAKYFDPLTKQPYKDKEAFKILRERYFQKEEDSLLFRIQTLSDLASQKKEKLKKIILSEGNSNKDYLGASKNILNMVNKYGILKNEGTELEKKVTTHRIYNRNRENCVNSGMLIEANKRQLVISKRIFRDKYSNRGAGGLDDEKI